MALTKTQKIDKIEIIGEYKKIQVRTATIIEEDGLELSRSFHRHVIFPNSDTSGEDAQVVAVCSAVHTGEVKAAYAAHLAAQAAEMSPE